MRIRVRHAGETSVVSVPPGSTVADVLRQARFAGDVGHERSIVEHRVLQPNGNPARAIVSGAPARPTLVLTRADVVTVLDGKDTVEPTVTKQVPLAPGGLPNALQYVQYAGKPGVALATVGKVSGEVLRTKVLTPAVPAHRATGLVAALTFDDGPDGRYTPAILAILQAKHVRAAFCEIGKQAQANPALTKAVVAGGNVLCNHTQDHVEGLDTAPVARVRQEIGGGQRSLVGIVKRSVPFYRPPGGSLGPVVYQVAAERHEPILYWSIDTRDWDRPPAPQIVQSVLAGLRPGAIILLHDGGGNRANTVAALPQIIDAVRAAGYTFTLPITTAPQVG